MNDQHGEVGHEPKVVYRTPPKVAFSMGIMAGLTLASLVAFIMTFSILQQHLGTDDTAVAQANGNTNGTVAGAEAPSPSVADDTTPTVDITLKDTDHIRGDADAPITLVEYSDFECPYCARHTPTVDQILEDYDGQVKLVFRHFPLSMHEHAQAAAEASECAAEQGKFWEMHDELFAMNEAGTMSVDNFKAAAGDLGLNQSQFDDCLDSGKYTQRVQDDFDEGAQLGVNGTPATFVNGQLVSGAVPYSNFKTIIDGLL